MTTDDIRDLFDGHGADESEEEDDEGEPESADGASLFGEPDSSDDSAAEGGDPLTAGSENASDGDFGGFASTERSPGGDTRDETSTGDGFDSGDEGYDADEWDDANESASTDPLESSVVPARDDPGSTETRKESPVDGRPDASSGERRETPTPDDADSRSTERPETPSRADRSEPAEARSESATSGPSASPPAEDHGDTQTADSPETERPAEPGPPNDAEGTATAEPTAASEETARAERTASSSNRPPPSATEPSRDDPTASPNAPASASAHADAEEAESETASGSNRLPTGIDVLDRAMEGGVPPGRLVVLVADPGVQSELIVDSVLAQRDTLFVTTDRPEWEVARDAEPGLGSGEVTIRDHTPDSLLLGLEDILEEVGRSSNLVIDSVNELELEPRPRYRNFLSDVKQRLFETGSVGLLTGVTVGHESARDLTLRRADVVWRLETRTTDHEIENRLSVPKFRGGAAVTEPVRLELTDEVRVARGWNDG